ncbi:MAG: carbohydrate ABC transporter permease [Halanaerobiales bacterium]
MGFPWEARKFVGFDNFMKFFTSSSVQNSLKLTILFTLLVTGISLVLGLLMAMLLNRDFKFKVVVITSILIPQTISPSILGLIWKLMYNSKYGVFNYFLRPFGLDQVWLGKDLAFASVVITSVWMATSFMTLISLAGLQNLPPDVYEAAELDGANKFQSFWNITLPLLKPVLGIAVILQQVACLHIFGIIYTLTGGGPGERTNVLAMEVYRQGLNNGFVGYGAAVATVLAVLALMISMVFIKFMGDEF